MLNTISKIRLVAYILISFGVFILDQSTKRHSQKVFLIQNTAHTRQYQAGAWRLLTLGSPPFEAHPQRGVVRIEDSTEPKGSWFYLNLTYLRNEGAIWGVFSQMNPKWRSWILNIITLIAFIVLINTFRDYPTRIAQTGTILIAGGALGNVIDRLRLGYVIDWIHPHWNILGWEYSFPVFNIADVAIDCGLVLLLLQLPLQKRQKKETESLLASS